MTHLRHDKVTMILWCATEADVSSLGYEYNIGYRLLSFLPGADVNRLI